MRVNDRIQWLHKKICEDIAEREKRLRAGINEEELKTFFCVMEKLKKNMENAE